MLYYFCQQILFPYLCFKNVAHTSGLKISFPDIAIGHDFNISVTEYILVQFSILQSITLLLNLGLLVIIFW